MNVFDEATLRKLEQLTLIADQVRVGFDRADARAKLLPETGRRNLGGHIKPEEVVETIDKALAPVRAGHPEFTISVTGLPAIAAAFA